MPEPTQSLREFFGEVRGIDAEKRTVTGYASTGEVDRYGEIVDPSAFKDLDRFLKERHIFAAGHRYVLDTGEPAVIGKVLDAHVDGKGLLATFQFDTDPLADAWFKKYQSGTIKSFSIGFIPRKWEMRDVKVGAETRQVRTYTDIEMLEISAVPIPANRESIVTNGLDPDRMEALAKQINDLQAYIKDFAEQVLTQVGVLTAGVPLPGGDEPLEPTPKGNASNGNMLESLRTLVGKS